MTSHDSPIWSSTITGEAVLTVIGEDDVEQDNTSRPLTSEEFDAMMRQMDEAQEWMIDQLKCRLIADASSPST